MLSIICGLVFCFQNIFSVFCPNRAIKYNSKRRRFFEISRASVAEVGACIDLMLAFGLIDQGKFESFKSRLIGISKMLWGLMR